MSHFNHFFKAGFVILSLPMLIACGSLADTDTSSDSSTTDTDAASSSAAAAVGSVFGGGSQSSVSVIPQATLSRFVELALEDGYGSPYENDEAYTCASVVEETSGPEGVAIAAYDDAGVYGSEDASVTLAAEDFCELADGTANTGDGPDGIGRFAAFEIQEDVTFDCTDEGVSSIVMQAGSAGVFRNTLETADAPAYMPQIFGTFNYLIDGTTEISLDCTIYLDEDETIVFADCSDENGDAIVQETDTTCSHSEE